MEMQQKQESCFKGIWLLRKDENKDNEINQDYSKNCGIKYLAALFRTCYSTLYSTLTLW